MLFDPLDTASIQLATRSVRKKSRPASDLISNPPLVQVEGLIPQLHQTASQPAALRPCAALSPAPFRRARRLHQKRGEKRAGEEGG